MNQHDQNNFEDDPWDRDPNAEDLICELLHLIGMHGAKQDICEKGTFSEAKYMTDDEGFIIHFAGMKFEIAVHCVGEAK